MKKPPLNMIENIQYTYVYNGRTFVFDVWPLSVVTHYAIITRRSPRTYTCGGKIKLYIVTVVNEKDKTKNPHHVHHWFLFDLFFASSIIIILRHCSDFRKFITTVFLILFSTQKKKIRVLRWDGVGFVWLFTYASIRHCQMYYCVIRFCFFIFANF